ncbi:outer membrane protein [Helicobacter cetorum]|uniref:Outer membrane protein 29 n=1 Tax=Helicobacter cetorum (strain ATCC BAA-429 / MIT 00-7128) TaxID=182217 RepID=I0ELH9_HELC0|nr:outer membrane protein [Helicobacter cetorum]AFI03798.1 outer membrane protein 29 [Helicobacter cetorum MIT 00-7128]
MKKTFVASVISLVMASVLSAEMPTKNSAVAKSSKSKSSKGERNAAFIGIDYQLGMLSTTEQNCSKATCDTDPVVTPGKGVSWGSTGSIYNKALTNQQYAINGFGFMTGYKHFLKKVPMFGFRYYAFFDFASSYYKYDVYGANYEYTRHGAQNYMFGYGGGTDILFNPAIFNRENLHFGFFLGIAIGGTSWGPMNHYYKDLAHTYGGRLATSNFQFLVNGGIRLGTKHQGFEIGLKIQTIRNNYYVANAAPYGEPFRATFHRPFAFYWRYIVSF